MAHQLQEGAAPGTPPANYVALYAKADGQLYSKDDAGVETPLGVSGSAFIDALAGLSSNGIIVKTGAAAAAVRTIQAGSGISVTNGDGIAADPIIALPNTAVVAGTYGGALQTVTLTVDAQGRLTAVATNPTIALDAADIANVPSGGISATDVQGAIDELDSEKLSDPTTTDGDMIYRDGGIQRLPIGTEDQLLRVVSGIPEWSDENLGQDFGDGYLGNVTLTGSFTALGPGYFATLALQPGGIYITAGYPIYCKALDVSTADAGAIRWDGNSGLNATTQTGAAAGAASTQQMLAGGPAGTSGASGVAGAGATATAPAAVTLGNGGAGGPSGAGGSGNAGANAGGAFGTGGQVQTSLVFARFEQQFIRAATVVGSANGGRGGSSGGGDGVNLGRGGGGGGGAAGTIAVYADEIITSVSTPAGTIKSMGGKGGNGASGAVGNVGGGGGGGAGGGGYIYLAYNKRTGPSVTSFAQSIGGTGGTGGNGIGTGTGGNGGNGGSSGRIDAINFGTLLGTHLNQLLGNAGAAAVGVTGGNGGAGATNSVDI